MSWFFVGKNTLYWMLIINTEDFRARFRCPNNTDVLLLLTKHQFLHFTFPGVDMEAFKIQPKKTFVKKAKPNNKKTHPDMLDEDFMKNNFSPRGPAGVCTVTALLRTMGSNQQAGGLDALKEMRKQVLFSSS